MSVVINSAESTPTTPNNDFFSGRLELDGGNLTVNSTGPWRLGDGADAGEIIFDHPTNGTSIIDGQKLIVENGMIQVLNATDARINAEVEYQADANIDVDNGELTHNGFTTYNGGTFTGLTIKQHADYRVINDTTISVQTFDPNGDDPADLQIDPGVTLVMDVDELGHIGVINEVDGDIYLGEGAALFVEDNFAGNVEINGNIVFDAASSATPLTTIGADSGVLLWGRVDGNGQFDGYVFNLGVVAPGTSAGLIRFGDGYGQAYTATYNVDIGGVIPITEYDQIDVVGPAYLDGELAITLDAGFTPSPGDVFEIMTYDALTDDFDRVTGDVVFGPGPSDFFVPVATGNAYLLYVPLPGDGNLDGTVDGLDYLLWAANYNDNPADDPPGAPQNGDYDGNGIVDGLDYLIWAGSYGTTAFINSAAAVPSRGPDYFWPSRRLCRCWYVASGEL